MMGSAAEGVPGSPIAAPIGKGPRMPQQPSETDKRARDAWLRALQRTASIGKLPHRTLPAVIAEVAQNCPDRPALIGESNSLTYRELADAVRRCADWAVRHGV